MSRFKSIRAFAKFEKRHKPAHLGGDRCHCGQGRILRDGVGHDLRPRYRCGYCADEHTVGHLGYAWDREPGPGARKPSGEPCDCARCAWRKNPVGDPPP